MKIELYGGPHDGTTVECPLSPPPCFLLPGFESPEIACIYWYDSLDPEQRPATFKYIFSGYETLAPEEQAAYALN